MVIIRDQDDRDGIERDLLINGESFVKGPHVSENNEYWERARDAADFAQWIKGKGIINFHEGWPIQPREERLKVLTQKLDGFLLHPAHHAEQMIQRWPTADIERLIMAANFIAIAMMFNADPHDTDMVGTGITCALYFYLSI